MNPVRVLGGLTRLTFIESYCWWFIWKYVLCLFLAKIDQLRHRLTHPVLSKRPSAIDRSTNVSSIFLID